MFSISFRTEMVALSSCCWHRRTSRSVSIPCLELTRRSMFVFCSLFFLSRRILMPIIGLIDILVGCICMTMSSCSFVYCWAFVWGLSTALMRPLAGESIFGLIERTGNFCPALALLWLSTGPSMTFYLFICASMIGTLTVSGLIFRQTGVLNG
jgi:hypothetical protein